MSLKKPHWIYKVFSERTIAAQLYSVTIALPRMQSSVHNSTAACNARPPMSQHISLKQGRTTEGKYVTDNPSIGITTVLTAYKQGVQGLYPKEHSVHGKCPHPHSSGSLLRKSILQTCLSQIDLVTLLTSDLVFFLCPNECKRSTVSLFRGDGRWESAV